MLHDTLAVIYAIFLSTSFIFWPQVKITKHFLTILNHHAFFFYIYLCVILFLSKFIFWLASTRLTFVIYVEMLVESIFWLHALDALRVQSIRKLKLCCDFCILSNCGYMHHSLLFMDKKSIFS
jgi:hypothetical protein